MIKLQKDINDVPLSLRPAFIDMFTTTNIPLVSRTTHGRRMDVISAGKYTDDSNHNSRYKTDDIKIALNNIYHGKCAFCEQKIEQSQVEHYRPKSIYHWLVYSWDNLILACAKCNQDKGTNFDTENNRVIFDNNEQNVRNINSSSAEYDENELPLMVNPEVTDPLGHIHFQKNGLIISDNRRFAYTIEKCSLDRIYLNVERKKILDDFRRDIQSIFVDNANDIPRQLIEIEVIFKKFIRDAKDIKNSYLAFRKYAIDYEWLTDVTKELSNVANNFKVKKLS